LAKELIECIGDIPPRKQSLRLRVISNDNDPTSCGKADSLRQINAALKNLGAEILDEPIPSALLAIVQSLSERK
jgi:hypothetical protein